MGKYCKEWAVADTFPVLPSDHFHIAYMVVLTLASLALTAGIKTMRTGDLHRILQDAGVAANKVATTAWETNRKLFKLTGLGVPMLHQIFLACSFSNSFCISLCWTITISWIVCDTLRIYVPAVRRMLDFVFKGILRRKEQDSLSSASYFLFGCALTVQLFAPVIAMTSIIFLVTGVLCSALISRSFGKSVVHIASGADRHKSVEGSAAMFIVCFVFGCSIFHQVRLREYSVIIAAITATLVEFFEPLGINYNVSIPVLTSIALTIGFERTLSCESSIVIVPS